jgi:hypothetical protein
MPQISALFPLDSGEKSQYPSILTINCWNEWTEGSNREPDTIDKMAYLEAVKNVFGGAPNKPGVVGDK